MRLIVQKIARLFAVVAGENDAIDAKVAKNRIAPASASLQVGASTVAAVNVAALYLKRRLRLAAKLVYFRFMRRVLGLKIGASSLKCRILVLDEPKALREDRARAVLVDEFLDKIKHRPFAVRV